MLDSWRDSFSFDLNKKNLIRLLSAVFLLAVFFWRLGSLTPGLSTAEINNISSSHSLRSLYAHPINAPHNVLIWALFKLGHVSATTARASSAIFGLIFSLAFYKIVRSWFGALVGSLNLLLFVSTPLVILSARSATADIMYLSPLALLALYFWLAKRTLPSKLGLVGLGLAATICAYMPGGIYVLMIALIFGRAELNKLLGDYSRRLKWSIGVVSAASLVPLGLAGYHNHLLIRSLFLVPDHAGAASLWLSRIGWMALALVWRSGSHSALQVGRLSILNIAVIALAACGIYAFWSRALSKIYGLAAIGVLSILGAGVLNQLSFLLTAAAIATIFAGAGLRYLQIEWQSIFPRNPLPKFLAIVLMSSAVLMSMFYGLNYSFEAWPHSISTKEVYVLKYSLKVRE